VHVPSQSFGLYNVCLMPHKAPSELVLAVLSNSFTVSQHSVITEQVQSDRGILEQIMA